MKVSRKEYKNYLEKEIGKGLTQKFKILTNNSSKAIYFIRKSEYFYGKGFFSNLLSKYYSNKLGKMYGIFINPKNRIDVGLKLPHPNGIIIGEAVNIGKNCTIYQQVTIGSANIGDARKGLQPQLGDNVTVFSGSKIIGNITLEDNTVVGANAVLTKSTQNNGVYVGIPAKLLKIKYDSKEN